MRTVRCLRRWRRAAGLGLLVVALALTVCRPANADLFFLKDGFVLQGKLIREHKLEVDAATAEPILIPQGLYLVDDGARRMYFCQLHVRLIDKKEGSEEKVLNPPPKTVTPLNLPPILEVHEASRWDDAWDRTLKYTGPQGPVTLKQHLSVLTPHYARVDTTARYFHAQTYLTRELGLDAVRALLATHTDFEEKKGLADADKLARRLRYFDFMAQAGWFGEAEEELNRIVRDLPEHKARAEEVRGNLAQALAREQFEYIKRLRQAGRHEATRKRLADFPEKSASEQTLAELREVRTAVNATAEKVEQATKFLTELPGTVPPAQRGRFTEMARAILEELHPDTVGRLDEFVAQANQVAQLRQKGEKVEIGPAELLSLAVTGWLLGNASAEAKPEAALRVWRGREMVLAYLRGADLKERSQTLSASEKERGPQAPLDEIAQIIPNLPPPEAEATIDTKPTEMKVTSGRRGASYWLQLPPEYRHGRPYPVLLLLHQAGEKPSAMLERWSEAAEENGYILAAPAWEEGLGGGGYTYSEREHAVVLDTLRDLRRRFQVDSDRVFLFGLGQGGVMAYDVGMSHPDLFAGVIPMSAGPDKFSERYFRNAQYLPFYVVNGDRAGESNKKIREQFQRNWVPRGARGYPMLWVQYKGRGQEWFAAEVPYIFDWMRPKKRLFPLRQLGTDGNRTELGDEFYTCRQSDNRFYWLTTDSINDRHCMVPGRWEPNVTSAQMTARIDPETNHIYVRTSGLNQLSIWLSRTAKGESMIDFDKPVTVHLGVELSKWTNKKVTPNLALMLEDVYQRGDRQRLFLAKIDLVLK
jgi:pimeloyl-ACP methyl ester carboxylesterase